MAGVAAGVAQAVRTGPLSLALAIAEPSAASDWLSCGCRAAESGDERPKTASTGSPRFIASWCWLKPVRCEGRLFI